jgi:hypothetical protein
VGMGAVEVFAEDGVGLAPQFAGSQQKIFAALWRLPDAVTPAAKRRLVHDFLADIAADPIPIRPHRKESRALKRRHNVFPYLTHPRA